MGSLSPLPRGVKGTSMAHLHGSILCSIHKCSVDGNNPKWPSIFVCIVNYLFYKIAQKIQGRKNNFNINSDFHDFKDKMLKYCANGDHSYTIATYPFITDDVEIYFS